MYPKHVIAKESALLYLAIENNNLCEIEKLLEIGKADPNYTQNGQSCLYEALKQQNYSTISLLLKYGAKAELNAYDSLLLFKSYSPLDIAMGAKKDIPVQMEAAKLLIKYGADYGGILTYNLSNEQKQELNFAREEYLAEGKEIIKKILESQADGQKITVDQLVHTLTREEFESKYISQCTTTYLSYLENAKNRPDTPSYNTSTIPHKINKSLKEIYNTSPHLPNSKSVIDYIKSLMGYRYHEDAITHQIHTHYKQIENLISLHQEQEQQFQAEPLTNIENISLSGENTEIHYFDYNI